MRDHLADLDAKITRCSCGAQIFDKYVCNAYPHDRRETPPCTPTK